MAKKDKVYTVLSDVDHKLQFVNLIGIINDIIPTIKRNKSLGNVMLEIYDATLNNPGFSATINLESEVLDQFLAVAKRGLIVELFDIKVAKNDGEVRGEIYDEKEIRLYDDVGSRLKWWIGEKTYSTLGRVKSAIEDLSKWKKKNFKETSEIMERVTNTPEVSKNISDSELSKRASGVSRRKTILVTNTSTSSESSPKDPNNKNKKMSAGRSVEAKQEKGSAKVKKPAGSLMSKNKNTDTDVSESPDKTTRRMDRKRKLVDEETPKSDLVSSDIFHKQRQNATRGTLKETVDDSFENNKSVSHQTRSENSKKSSNTLMIKGCPTKKGDKITENIQSPAKSDKSLINRTGSKKDKIGSGGSNLDSRGETKLRKYGSPTSSDNETIKSSPMTKSAKEKLTSRISRSKANISSSSSGSISSVDLNDSRSCLKVVVSSSAKIKLDGKSQNASKKQHSLSNDSKEIQNESSPLIVKDGSLSSKITRSSNSSQTSLSKKKGAAKYSTCLRRRILNSSIESIDSSSISSASASFEFKDSRSSRSSQLKLNEEPSNAKAKETKGQNTKIIRGKKISTQNKSSTPVHHSKDPSKLYKEKEVNIKNIMNVEQQLIDSNKMVVGFETPIKLTNQTLNDGTIVNTKKTPSSQKSLGKQCPPTSAQLTKTTADQEGTSKKLNRKTKNNEKDIEASTINRKDIMSRLGLLTRKIHVIEVESCCDISTCDIEDIDVPDKFDLQCKVMSEFVLFEENIQIVRVQDGTVSKSATLSIPKKTSWEEIVAAVLKKPTVQKNSPFIDIIILDFPRMDNPIVSGNFYHFKNVMAIKLNLKNDPREGSKPKGELFFCANGPNIYNAKLKPSTRQELEENLNEEKYEKLCEGFLCDEIADLGKSDVHSENVLSSSRLQENVGEGISGVKSIDKGLQIPVRSPTNKKRKQPEVELDSKDCETSNKTSQKVGSKEELCSKKRKKTSTNDNKVNGNIQPKIDTTAFSDETMLGETEALIVRELSEIMHEESVLGLPQTLSEDIHLKNTGSEITFSQFCEGAKGKPANFRTSTQADSLSDDIVPLNQKEASLSVDSSKMEPLVYCSSSSSVSGAISPTKHIKSSEMCKGVKECSESILQSCSTKKISSTTTTRKSVNVRKDKNESTVKASDDSLSVQVLSSNSSDIEFEVVSQEDCSNENNNSLDKTKTIPNSEGNKFFKSSVLSPRTNILSARSVDELETKLGSKNTHLDKQIRESHYEQVEVVSDSNSTNVSKFSYEYIPSVSCEKPPGVSKNRDVQAQMNQSTEVNDSHDHRLKDGQYPSSYEQCKKIPDSCFFKSTRNLDPSAEEINAICNDENQSIKYFSYSLNRSLPFLTFDVIRKLASKNFITVTVTIESISPSFTDSWKEDYIKSRCSCCNKMYSSYNALNNKNSESTSSLNALSVRGLVVCPESQCCNQVLETPEFHFSVDTKLKDGSLVTALVSGAHAEQIFGCKAQEAANNENALSRVKGILQQISRKITEGQSVRVDFFRENICNPKSGPLYIQKFYF